MGHNSSDIASYRALHEQMGCIVFDNPRMSRHFIAEPDSQWIEIVPAK